MNSNISIFDLEKQNKISAKLDVVKANFEEVSSVTVDELFGGYDELYAITYSSSMGFICDILENFKYAEIIFGFEDLISDSLQEIFAFQTITLEKLREESNKKKLDLLSRVEKEALKLYVSRDKLSHEKTYILKAEDGRVRVITGSANMSYAAFQGKQRETIIYFDDIEAYKWYFETFRNLKESSTDDISRKAIEIGDAKENLDNLPISETLKVKKTMVIERSSKLNEEVKFALDVKNLAKKNAPFMPKSNKGKIIISHQDIVHIRRRIIEGSNREKEAKQEYPKLRIDIENKEVYINENKVDLNPSREEITRDINLFIEYMEGYRKFHGDFSSLQYKYYAFAVWFFTSPFMPTMRNTANIFNHSTMLYPVFGIIYGQSKAGKTTFLETMLKMMIGQKTKLSAPDFTRSSIDGLRRTVMGSPIIVDDLTQQRFSQHGIETIKNDDFGMADNLNTYPAVVISANEDIKAIAPEVVRRAVICNVKAGLKNTELMKINLVRKVQRNLGTAFYREFLKKMLEVMPELLNELKDEEAEVGPDIINEASKILLEIIHENSSVDIPEYFREISVEDYFDEKTTGSQAIKKISEAWIVNRKAFTVDKKMNSISYSAGETWEASRILKELPEDLEAYTSRDLVVMNLEKAIEFFDINFNEKEGIIKKIKNIMT